MGTLRNILIPNNILALGIFSMPISSIIVALGNIQQCLIVWVTDNSAAAFGINKGRGKSDGTYQLISDVLSICDSEKFQIVAIWIPRERKNTLADHLSHLASSLNRFSIEGQLYRLEEEDTSLAERP